MRKLIITIVICLFIEQVSAQLSDNVRKEIIRAANEYIIGSAQIYFLWPWTYNIEDSFFLKPVSINEVDFIAQKMVIRRRKVLKILEQKRRDVRKILNTLRDKGLFLEEQVQMGLPAVDAASNCFLVERGTFEGLSNSHLHYKDIVFVFPTNDTLDFDAQNKQYRPSFFIPRYLRQYITHIFSELRHDVPDSLQYLVKDIKLLSYSSELYFSEEVQKYSYYKRYCFFDGSINKIMISPHLIHLAFVYYIRHFDIIPHLIRYDENAVNGNNFWQKSESKFLLDSLFNYFDGFASFLFSHELSHAKLGKKNIFGETVPELDEARCDCYAVLKCKELYKNFNPALFIQFLKLIVRKDEFNDISTRSKLLTELTTLQIQQLQERCK